MSKTLQPDRTPQATVKGVTLKSNIEAIKALYNLTSTSRGPSGKIKLLQNLLGGNLTITSSSKCLFSSLSVRNPIIQLLVSIVQGHLAAYGDGGLFLTNFASLLIVKSMESKLRGRLLAEIFESFLSLSVSYLQSQECLSKVKVSFSDIIFMNTVVKSVLRSKPLCNLNPSKMRHIAQLVLECFINIACDNSYNSCTNHVFFLTVENVPVEQSKVLPGLLITAPELSTFQQQQLCIIKSGNSDAITVAMVTVSMSGDMEELEAGLFETEEGVDIEEQILEEIAKFCDHLVGLGVGLLLCQKVIHPQLKYRLRTARVCVVDRVGLQPVKYLQRLIGAQPITSLRVPVERDHLGEVDDVQHCILNDRSYLHLTRADNSVCTCVLCHQEEQALNELKNVSSVAMETLDQLVQAPYLLTGGGCWQVDVARYVTQQVTVNLQQLSEELECKTATLTTAAEIFTSALLQSVLPYPSHYTFSAHTGHLHKIKGNNSSEPYTANDVEKFCGCRIYESEADDMLMSVMTRCSSVCSERTNSKVQDNISEILNSREVTLDSFSMCVNAFQSAVLAAVSVLRIGQTLVNCV